MLAGEGMIVVDEGVAAAMGVVVVWLVGRFANRPYGLAGWRGLGVAVVAWPRSALGILRERRFADKRTLRGAKERDGRRTRTPASDDCATLRSQLLPCGGRSRRRRRFLGGVR